MNRPPRTLSSIEETRLVAGLLVQPFLAAGLAFVMFPVLLLDGAGRTLAGGYPSDPTDAALSVAGGIGILAVVVTLIGVLPTAVWLMKRYQLTLGQTLAFGLGFGNLPYVLLAVAAGGGTYGPSGLLRGLTFASVLGLSGAAMFWIITIRPRTVRPDSAAA